MAAAEATEPWEIRHFRIASNAILVLAATSAIGGHVGDHAWLVELAIALAVLAGGFRLLFEAFPRTRPKLITLHPSHFFLDTWRELDADALADRNAKRKAIRFAQLRADAVRRSRAAADEGTDFDLEAELEKARAQVDAELASGAIATTTTLPYDYRPAVALAFGAVCLAVMEYFGHSETFLAVLDFFDPPFHPGPPTNFAGTIRNGDFLELWEFAWWSAFRVLGYMILPALLVKLGFRERVRDQGLETRGFLEHAWIYVLGYAVVFVCVVFVSRNDEGFQTYYPFYHQAGRSWLDFGCWEVLYAAQFFSLEFFFRGFWLRSMKRAMGSQAIFAMVVPYCMIHFGKPFPETLAAIVAGLFLGTLAMKTRSIWSGFLIHVSVAISMDLASLAVAHDWPSQMWPPGW